MVNAVALPGLGVVSAEIAVTMLSWVGGLVGSGDHHSAESALFAAVAVRARGALSASCSRGMLGLALPLRAVHRQPDRQSYDVFIGDACV